MTIIGRKLKIMEESNFAKRHQFQLIDNDGNINKSTRLEREIKKLEIKAGTSSKEYFSIAIIGVQSSGKSTLLNELFGTNFKVMSIKKASQTTKGIWVSSDNERKIVLYDIEGSDSSERGQIDETFEYKLALFGLAVADLLIVNVGNPKSIMRNTGFVKSLRRILKAHLSLFPHNENIKKRILFIVRDSIKSPKKWDFEKKKSDFEVLQAKRKDEEEIEKIMIEIWENIEEKRKPDSIDDVINVSYYHMSKFTSNPTKRRDKKLKKMFYQQVEILRNKIQKENGKYRKGHSLENNFPINKLSDTLEDIWQRVLNNEVINLGSMRELADEGMCRAIQKRILESQEFQEENENVKKLLENYESIKEKCKNILNFASTKYLEETRRFHKRAAENIHKELMDDIQSKLILFSNIFYEKIYEEKFREFKNIINELSKKNIDRGKFYSEFEKNLKEKIDEFDESMKEKIAYEFFSDDMAASLKGKMKKKFKEIFWEYFDKWLKNYLENRLVKFAQDLKKKIPSVDEINKFFKIILNELKNLRKTMTEWIEDQPLDENLKKKKSEYYQDMLKKYKKDLEEIVVKEIDYEKCLNLYSDKNMTDFTKKKLKEISFKERYEKQNDLKTLENEISEEVLSKFTQNIENYFEKIEIEQEEFENLKNLVNEVKKEVKKFFDKPMIFENMKELVKSFVAKKNSIEILEINKKLSKEAEDELKKTEKDYEKKVNEADEQKKILEEEQEKASQLKKNTSNLRIIETTLYTISSFAKLGADLYSRKKNSDATKKSRSRESRSRESRSRESRSRESRSRESRSRESRSRESRSRESRRREPRSKKISPERNKIYLENQLKMPERDILPKELIFSEKIARKRNSNMFEMKKEVNDSPNFIPKIMSQMMSKMFTKKSENKKKI